MGWVYLMVRQQDAFFQPTHSYNATGSVCRVIKELRRGEVIVEFINGMQSRIAKSEITKIKEHGNGKNNRHRS